jgi:hypothetical protein
LTAHFLDDRPALTNLLNNHPLQYICLAKLVLDGGELRSSPAFITHAIDTLLAAGRIQRVENSKSSFRIAGWDASRFKNTEAPQSNVVPGPVAVTPVKIQVGHRYPQAAIDVVNYYHQTVSNKGPYGEAVSNAEYWLNEGWTREELLTCVDNYKASRPKYVLWAPTFFRPTAGVFEGMKYRDALPETRTPSASQPGDIMQLAAIMKEKAV